MALQAVVRRIGAGQVREILDGLGDAASGLPSCARRTVEEEWAQLLAEFDLGFSEGAAFVEEGDPATLHEAIAGIYLDRFRWLYQTAGTTLSSQLLQLEQLSKQLGTLTGRLFAAELTRPDLYYGNPDERPQLARKHLETARDMLGFYLNTRIASRHRRRITLQTEDSCPLCP